MLGTNGAELGELLQTADRIIAGDFESWIREWSATAAQVATTAEAALSKKQFITARQAFRRASNYFQRALFYATVDDPRHKVLWTQGRDCFHQAIRLMSPSPEIVEIPFSNAMLPGYFIKGGEGPRPTLIAVNGFDGTMEEACHWIGFAAAERGWNCLAFEGPGQWSALYRNPGLTLRPDYEVPIKAVVDYALQRPDVDGERLALIGYSLGGYLAPRAASFDPRIRACIANSPVTDIGDAFRSGWPAELVAAPPAVFDEAFVAISESSPPARWAFGHGRWTMGLQHPHEFLDAWMPYTLHGLGTRMHCPLLCLVGEDEIAQATLKVTEAVMRYVDDVTSDTTLHFFTRDQGAASHCQMGGILLAQAAIFEWLDRILNPEQAQGTPTHQIDPQFLPALRRHHGGEELEAMLPTFKMFRDLHHPESTSP
jgi:pimeloyl-ACP methyl ester carboxylesterase